jgi:hypothetical protein
MHVGNGHHLQNGNSDAIINDKMTLGVNSVLKKYLYNLNSNV